MELKYISAVKRIITVLCIIIPILLGYSSYGMVWSNWALIVMFPFVLTALWKLDRIVIMPEMIVLIAFLIFQAGYTYLAGGNIASVFQQIFLLFYVAAVLPNLTERQTEFTAYKWICIISTVFIFLQLLIAKKYNYYLSGALPIGNSVQTVYANEMNSGGIEWLPVRPRSLFTEPSAYGIYIAMLVVLILWHFKLNLSNWILIFVLCLGLLCSRSSTGILLMLLGWLGLLVKTIMKKRSDRLFIVFMVLLLIAAVCAMNTESVQVFIQHTFNSGSGGTNARIGGYAYVFDLNKYTPMQLLLGHGVKEAANEPFLGGWARLMWHMGLLGMAVYGWLVFVLFKKGNAMQKSIIFILAVQNVFAMCLYSIAIPFYYSLYIVCKSDVEKCKY